MNKKQLRILVAPLDWGLGHVTRCLPLMHTILSSGHQVIFAGNNSQQDYIKSIYPNIECHFLKGYNVQYAKTKLALIPKIIAQLPRLKRTIKQEHLWLQNFIKTQQIDAVISDNRYGLYSHLIPCVIMTHQLQIKSGYNNLLDKLLLKFHYRFIEKFKECWVVDIAEEEGLSGSLAHPKILPKIKAHYLGLLSRCAGKQKNSEENQDFYVLILLSGTEPQRTILNDILWKKAIKSDKHIIFVAGNENAVLPAVIPGHISYHKRLTNDDLVTAINAASIVICRSGYSSIMDLLALNKKAILIPTPGQTEQEYLAQLMHKKRIFMSAAQEKFDIQTSLLNASLFPFANHHYKDSFNQHKLIVDSFLIELQSTRKA